MWMENAKALSKKLTRKSDSSITFCNVMLLGKDIFIIRDHILSFFQSLRHSLPKRRALLFAVRCTRLCRGVL